MLLKHKLFRWQVLSLFEKVHSRELTRQILISFRLFKKTRFECSVIVLTNFLKKKIDRTKNHIPFIFRQVIPSIRDPRTSVPWSAFSSWSIFRSVDPCPQSHFYFLFFNIIQAALVLNKSLGKKFGIWSGFCFQKWHWVIHPKWIFFLNYRKLLRIDTHGFCFPKWRSMTLPNDLGFCFRKWRSVTHPGFWEYFTLTLNIFFWWRHTSDVTSCMYTLTSTLTTTYDVTVQL